MSTGSSPSASVELKVPRKGWALPESMRGQMSMPFGDLVDDDDAIRQLEGAEQVITVGDVVSLRMLQGGVRPRLMVFDLMNERRRMGELQGLLDGLQGRDVEVENPAGHITPSLVREVRHALGSPGMTKLKVLGEEDLAALVCAAYASDDARLLYGLPRKGIVLVRIDQKVRDKARALINAMEECR